MARSSSSGTFGMVARKALRRSTVSILLRVTLCEETEITLRAEMVRKVPLED
jgi:hypothetical protein